MTKLFRFTLTIGVLLCTLAQSVFAMSPDGPLKYQGADISRYQTVTSWAKVKAAVDFLYIRAGYGASRSDTLGTDKKLLSHVSGAKSAGIKYGFYWFLRPSVSLSFVKKQAKAFYNATKTYKAACRPVLDVEMFPGKSYTLKKFSAKMVKASVRAFTAEYKQLSGRQPMIYASPSYVNEYLDDTAFAKLYYWEAFYTSSRPPKDTKVWHRYVLWQYTSHGRLAGIAGLVDRDRGTYKIFWPDSTVKAAQKNLAVIGYPLAVNGLMDEKTTAAVTDMQRRNGLTATGRLNAATAALIKRAAAKKLHPTLRKGSRGEAVKLLQRTLTAKGYTLKADGIFGSKTEAAVHRFQQRHKILVDGICGPVTWETLSA